LVEKLEGKRQLGRPARRWVDITVYLIETGWGCRLHLSGSRQGPVAGYCKQRNEPLGFIHDIHY